MSRQLHPGVIRVATRLMVKLSKKGGIAQWLRTRYWESRADRPVYTCVGSGCDGGTTGIDLAAAGSNYVFQTDNTSLTAAMLGVGSSTRARTGDPLDPRTRQRHQHQRRQ